MAEIESDAARRARKERLLQFYRTMQQEDEIQASGGESSSITSATSTAATIRGMSSGGPSIDPSLDLESNRFDAQRYVQSLLKDHSLTQLMDHEREMIEKIRSLDSEMQNLVYDNYNKFIYATDTIKNMKSDFRKMDEEMKQLGEKMTHITEMSTSIRTALHPRRERINQLAGTHHLLRKMQYLLELPNRLRICVNEGQYVRAVGYYNKARLVLHRYADIPSFHGIRDDCGAIMDGLRRTLWSRFTHATDVEELASVVDILRQLEEPLDKLADAFIELSEKLLAQSFDALRTELQASIRPGSSLPEATPILPAAGAAHPPAPANLPALNPFRTDVLHFANMATDLVLDKLSQQVTVYTELFLTGPAHSTESGEVDKRRQQALVAYLDRIMADFFQIIQQRMSLERESGDNSLFVRALDRVHSRLQALNRVVPPADFCSRGLVLLGQLASQRCQHYLHALQRYLQDCLTDVRQRLLATPLGSAAGAVASVKGSDPSSLSSPLGPHSQSGLLRELSQRTSQALVEQIKSTLNAQQSFIDLDNTFSKKIAFQSQFCIVDVREGLVVVFLRHMLAVFLTLMDEHTISNGGTSVAQLVLILSRLCFDWCSGGPGGAAGGGVATLEYVLTLVDEQFLVRTLASQCPQHAARITRVSELSTEFHNMAHRLMNAYVRAQGASLSQMIRKSVETRDWLNSIEPRTVRSVMKRVVEDVASMDSQVAQMFPSAGTAQQSRDRGSDSSSRRRRGQLGVGTESLGAGSGTGRFSQWSLTPSTLDNNLLTHINKLFAEKIDVFAPVDACRESILTGVVKIALKAFIECVRLRTFGRFGLQQLQVDCRYLQIYLWRFVADEKLVNVLLEEVVGGCMQRCIDVQLMDDTIIEMICERT